MSRLDEILALPKVTHNLVQGTPPWDQFRLEHRGASEAAAVLGLSKNIQRNELLRMKHTGIAREFSEWLQKNVLDHGHAVEAKARPHVEKLIGKELYPVTCSRGSLSASCDGLDMDDRIAFEHKQWAADLAAMVDAGIVPDEHMPQCQQVLLVTGAEELIFVVSDGTPERMVWAKVTPDRAWWERIVDGWDQFDVDLAQYVVPEPRPAEPIGVKPEHLPALIIDVRGEVLDSNLEVWKAAAIARIESVNTKLVTDDDFANAKEAVKWCKESADLLKATKAAALAKMGTVEAVFAAVDKVISTFDAKRINLDNLVTTRNDARKKEIVDAGQRALDLHLQALDARLLALLPEGTRVAASLMPAVKADFWGAIKGKRSFANMESAVSDELANGKVVGNKACELRERNLRALQDKGKDHRHLFADWRDLIGKDAELVELTIGQRIQEEKDAEERRLEAERGRIRAEEETRATEAAREKNAMALQEIQGIQQQVAIATLGRAGVRKGGSIECIRDTLAETEAWVIDEEHFGALTGAAQAAKDRAVAEIRQLLADEEKPVPEPVAAATDHYLPASQASTALAPSPGVVPIRRVAAAPATQPTLRLGEINKRIAPLSIDAAGLASLGFQHAKQEGAAKLWHEHQFDAICDALIAHVAAARDAQLEVA